MPRAAGDCPLRVAHLTRPVPRQVNNWNLITNKGASNMAFGKKHSVATAKRPPKKLSGKAATPPIQATMPPKAQRAKGKLDADGDVDLAQTASFPAGKTTAAKKTF